LQNWSSPKYESYPVKINGKNTTFVKSRGFPFEGEDLKELIEEMVKLPSKDTNDSYLGSIEMESASAYNRSLLLERKKRIQLFNPVQAFFENDKIKSEFELPKGVKKWVDRFEAIDIEFWLKWLNRIPTPEFLVPDFGIAEKLEARIDELLLAADRAAVCDPE
jgi:hypothetical protein